MAVTVVRTYGSAKGAFSLQRMSGPPRTERSLRLIWLQTLDPETSERC